MIHLDELCSPEYRQQLYMMEDRWAGKAEAFIPELLYLAGKVAAKSFLDYGCGTGSFGRAMLAHGWNVDEYDPGITGKDRLPGPSDLVVCTDVLEHIEPERLPIVIKHIHSLAKKACYFVVATRPAEKRLPDGRNAHLIIDNDHWWLSQLGNYNWHIHQLPCSVEGAVKFWARV